MNELHYILLYVTKKFAGDRTIYGMYHLLKGKKSSQTSQDVKMYRMNHLFNVFPTVKREQIESHIAYLEQYKLIEMSEEHTYVITMSGMDRLIQHEQVAPLPVSLDGRLYGRRAGVFWRRLSLLLQTLSHLKRKNKSFQPIIQDYEITRWVKSFLLHGGYSREELSRSLYDECLALLRMQGEKQAELFVLRLTGHDRIGLTNEQAGVVIGCDEWRTSLLFQSILHQMIRKIDEHGDDLMMKKICPAGEGPSYSISAKATYELLQHGNTLADISKKRNIKQNTVEDHLVEIALHEELFSIDSFVSIEKQQQIRMAYEAMNTKKLRLLKERIGGDVTYFQIRLVLAKVGEE